MAGEIDNIRSHLRHLGERISAQRQELERDGLLHGEARELAADFQIKHASALRKASSHPSVGEAISDELRTDVEILNHTFERWLARLDKKSERSGNT